MEKIIIGGAAFIFGLGELKEAFEALGHQLKFIEAPFMNDYIEIDEKNLVNFSADLEEEGVLLPVSEYWITKALENSKSRINIRALKASRSKVYFSKLLEENGVKVSSPVSVENACEGFLEGRKYIVKPEGLYSGYGVRLVESKAELENALEKCACVKTHSLKLFGINNKTPVIWENIEGTEYSADCFLYGGKMEVVRVCRKRIALIHNNPCTVAIQIIPCSDRILKALTKWNSILFDENDISFSQFDFIDDGENLVPVDFASRVGGGMANLLKMAGNPYAKAVRRMAEQFGLHKTQGCSIVFDKADCKKGYPSQVNYLPVRSGKIKNLSFETVTERTVYNKKPGDFVPESPSSVASRIATGFGFLDNLDELPLEKLLLGDSFIGDWKKV